MLILYGSKTEKTNVQNISDIRYIELHIFETSSIDPRQMVIN